MKKPKVYQFEFCKDIITDPYKAKMREFYLSQEHKYLIGGFVPRAVRRTVTICGSCYRKISNATINEKFG